MTNVVLYPIRAAFSPFEVGMTSEAATADTRRIISLLAGAEARRIASLTGAASAASQRDAVSRFRTILRQGGCNDGDADVAIGWFREALSRACYRERLARSGVNA